MNQRLDSTALWVEPNTTGKAEASKKERRKKNEREDRKQRNDS